MPPLQYLDVLVRVFSALHVCDTIPSLKLFDWIINQPYCSIELICINTKLFYDIGVSIISSILFYDMRFDFYFPIYTTGSGCGCRCQWCINIRLRFTGFVMLISIIELCKCISGLQAREFNTETENTSPILIDYILCSSGSITYTSNINALFLLRIVEKLDSRIIQFQLNPNFILSGETHALLRRFIAFFFAFNIQIKSLRKLSPHLRPKNATNFVLRGGKKSQDKRATQNRRVETMETLRGEKRMENPHKEQFIPSVSYEWNTRKLL